MKRTFLVHHIPVFTGWETCFHTLMEKAETFQIIFQGNKDTFDADGFLNAGKREFLDLPSITISPYEGMDNSIKVTGELNTMAREVFLTFMAPSQPDLWSFQFLRGNEVILRVEDFTLALLFLEESDVEDLLAQGVTGLDELEIDSISEGESQPGIQVVSWNKDELASLADQLQTSFLADQENVSTHPEGANGND